MLNRELKFVDSLMSRNRMTYIGLNFKNSKTIFMDYAYLSVEIIYCANQIVSAIMLRLSANGMDMIEVSLLR